jgi:hypothetical protein
MPRRSIWQAKLAAPEAKVELVVVAAPREARITRGLRDEARQG